VGQRAWVVQELDVALPLVDQKVSVVQELDVSLLLVDQRAWVVEELDVSLLSVDQKVSVVEELDEQPSLGYLAHQDRASLVLLAVVVEEDQQHGAS
jgi:hypothetical protein